MTVHASGEAAPDTTAPRTTATDPAAKAWREAAEAAVTDPDAAALLAGGGMSLRLVLHDPETDLFLDAEGVTEKVGNATLLLETDSATLALVLTGRLGMTQAVIHRRLTVRGPVARMRRLAPLLTALGTAYATRAAAARAA